MKRTDIRPHDVFISWTGDDRDLKDKIYKYLSERDISCLESDKSCSGDFRQWSDEAVGACTVFLLIYTEHTLSSAYVPVEIEAYSRLDGFENRIVPVCESRELHKNLPYGIPSYGSAVILNGKDVSEEQLEKIYHNVSTLIVNRLDRVYREAVKPDYMRLIPLLGAKNFADREYDYSKLYIPRMLKNEDEEDIFDFSGKKKTTFICGSAGSGKTRYVEELCANAGEDTLSMVLSCSAVSQSEENLEGDMYQKFASLCKNRSFFTEADFTSLIKNRGLTLIFDGMDEISTVDGTRRFIRKVEDLCKSGVENVSFVFTSRNMSDADLIAFDGRGVQRYTLEKLSEIEIEKLGESLFSLFGSADKKTDFFKRIEPLDGEIKSNPLLLSQLAIIFEDTGEIPDTIVGIYDAVSKITLALDKGREIARVPSEYRSMLSYGIEKILSAFAAEKYTLASRGKNIEARKILAKILRETYADADARAEFLFEYLHSRAILVDGNFEHKTFLEYYTAVNFYERCFDDYDELCDTAALRELFSHYGDAYWADVIRMFLVKADGAVDTENTKALYSEALFCGIDEYTLLFESACALSKNKVEALTVLLSNLLLRSSKHELPPYGPLFWYVPNYNLYRELVTALSLFEDENYLAQATALTRDVCFILGGYDSVKEVADGADGEKLFMRACDGLSDVRRALCELFYLGKTDFCGGENIYPRCFNVAEAKSFAKNGCGVFCEMDAPFCDTLSLYKHVSYNEVCGEHIGFISCSGEAAKTEAALAGKSTSKVTAVAFTLSDSTEFLPMNFNASNVRLSYIPENALPSYGAFSGGRGLLCGFSVVCGKKVYHRGKILIPTEFTEIEIKNGNNIEEIILADGFENINARAFSKLVNLKKINVPSSVREIGDGALKNCRRLKNAVLPSGLERIGESAFFNCASLCEIKIPSGVREIPGSCFAGCISLEKADLPDSLERIGDSAFASTAIGEAVLDGEIREIGREAFTKCKNLSRVLLQSGLLEIGERAFSECESLSQIIIPKTVRTIGEDAFASSTEVIREDCMQMYTVSLEGITEIPDYAFAGHKDITEIEIPSGVERIGYGAFAGCENLRSITVPKSVCEISRNAFYGCASLKEIVLPSGLREIADETFSGCRSLENAVIPSSVQSIGDGAFSACESLDRISLPESVREIGSGAFLGCTSLTKMVLPPKLETVEAYTFYDCKNLREVTLGKNVKDVLAFAFFDCRNLLELFIPSGVRYDRDAFDPSTNLIFEDEGADTVTVSELRENGEYSYAGTRIRKLVLEEGITEIYPFTFGSCENLESISFPSTLERIGVCAFEECPKIEELSLPDGLFEIGDRAFYFCKGLKNVRLPESISEIGVGTFAFCSSLERVTMPKEYFGEIVGTFSYCKSLREIEIPNGVGKIDFQAFCGCWSLSKVALPDSLSVIGGASFAECKSLSQIKLPSGLSEIGALAFSKCESLKEISIPASVKNIGNSAFEECSSLESVEISFRFEGDIERIFGDIDRKIIKFI